MHENLPRQARMSSFLQGDFRTESLHRIVTKEIIVIIKDRSSLHRNSIPASSTTAIQL